MSTTVVFLLSFGLAASFVAAVLSLSTVLLIIYSWYHRFVWDTFLSTSVSTTAIIDDVGGLLVAYVGNARVGPR